MERYVQSACYGIFPAVLVAGKENRETLSEARGMGFPEYFHDFRVREPFWDIFSAAQAGTELRAGDVECADAWGDFVVGFVFVAVGEVDHLLEGYNFDAEFLSILFYRVLCVIRSVEILPSTVLAGAGVIAADDEVGCTVVFADDGVPDCFSGSAHAHC